MQPVQEMFWSVVVDVYIFILHIEQHEKENNNINKDNTHKSQVIAYNTHTGRCSWK